MLSNWTVGVIFTFCFVVIILVAFLLLINFSENETNTEDRTTEFHYFPPGFGANNKEKEGRP